MGCRFNSRTLNRTRVRTVVQTVGLGGCVIVGGGVGEPPNRQCTALLNQGIDLLNHDIASKTLSGVKLELARRGGQ